MTDAYLGRRTDDKGLEIDHPTSRDVGRAFVIAVTSRSIWKIYVHIAQTSSLDSVLYTCILLLGLSVFTRSHMATWLHVHICS